MACKPGSLIRTVFLFLEHFINRKPYQGYQDVRDYHQVYDSVIDRLRLAGIARAFQRSAAHGTLTVTLKGKENGK